MPHQTKQRTASLPLALLRGLAASVTVTLILSAVTATLVAAERVGEGFCATAAVVTMLLSAFVGTICASAKTDGNRMLVCLLASVCYFAALVCGNAVLVGGHYRGIAPALLAVLGVGLVCALGKPHRKKRKYAHAPRR